MTGGTTEVRNIRFDSQIGLRLPREVQRTRIRRVMDAELTECQRKTLYDYYFRQLTITQITREQQVNKSTVCRTLHRAEDRIRRYLTY